MADESDYFRAYARDVGLNPLVGGVNNVQDALAAAGGGPLITTVHLGAAAIGTLHSAPTQLIVAQGPNTAIIVIAGIAELEVGLSGWDNAVPDVGLYYGASSDDADTASQGFSNIFNAYPNVSGFVTFGAGDNSIGGSTAWSARLVPSAVADNRGLYIADQLADMPPLGRLLTATLAAAGTDYAPNDTGTITPAVGTIPAATYRITTVGALGIVTGFTITDPGGALYDLTHNPIATATGGAQPGAGTGFTVNVTSVTPPDGDLYVTVVYHVLALH